MIANNQHIIDNILFEVVDPLSLLVGDLLVVWNITEYHHHHLWPISANNDFSFVKCNL